MTRFIDLTLDGDLQRSRLRRGGPGAGAHLARDADRQLRPGRDVDGDHVHRLRGDHQERLLSGLDWSSRSLSGLVLGAVVERILIRPVESAPPLNAVIMTLGLYTLLVAAAGMIWGNTPRSFPAAFSLRGYRVGGTTLLFTPNDTFIVLTVIAVAGLLAAVFRFTSIGLRMRAAAFAPEVARLLGVRVGNMFTIGWALAALVGALAGVLVAPSVFLGPNSFDPLLISGFVAAVIGGLDSPPGAVVGGIALGLALSYVSGYAGSSLVPLAALAILVVVLMLRPGGLFSASKERRV